MKLLIINTNDSQTLGILDVSEYPTSNPNGLSIEITPPGFNKVVIPFVPNNLTIYTNKNLNINCTENNDLPDGLYYFKLSYTPAYENYYEKWFYRTDKLQSKLDEAFLKSNLAKCGKPSKQDRQQLTDAYLYTQGAKAAADICEYDLATSLYNKAVDIIDNFQTQGGC